VGDYLLKQLQGLQAEFPCIGDVRGVGLMAGGGALLQLCLLTWQVAASRAMLTLHRV
jgi:acetylornithine/succinyldiaminopimelate/putrescine aminotransferase